MQPTDTSNPDYFHKVVDCQWACPAHTNVPEYIRLIAQGRYTDAYMLNRESNVFPGILGRTCDRPCEPACRRGRVDGKPVAICRLKRVAADLKRRDSGSSAAHSGSEERQAHRLHRRRPRIAGSRERPDAARLSSHDLRKARQARRPDAHEHPVLPPARACPYGRDRRHPQHGRGDSLQLFRRQHGRSAGRGFDAVFVGSGAPRGKESRSARPLRNGSHSYRYRLAGLGRVRAHAFDRRTRSDHRRRQYGDGLLPLFAKAGRHETSK